MKKIFLIVTITTMLAMVGACGNKKTDKADSTTQTEQTTQNTRMHYNDLGNTGLKVSEISIGCGAFEEMDTTQSRAFMDIVLDSGMNYIDLYDANPKVRGNIGYALQGRRDRMIIQGHIGSYWDEEKQQYKRTRDLEETRKGFEEMLRLLGTDHIEVGMIHIVDKVEEWEEIANSPFMDYVKQLKAEGKIKHIGVSSHNVNAALAAVKSGDIEVLMFSLNPLFDRMAPDASPWDKKSYDKLSAGIDPKRVELYNYCTKNRIAITVMKVFGGGGKLLNDDSPLHVKLTPSQCIQYCLDNPCVATAICGAQTIDELMSDLHYLQATAEEKDYNSAIAENDKQSPKQASAQASGCTYCGHCSPCPVGIDIAKVNELLDKAAKSDKDKAVAKAEYDKLEHHASECIGCGACEDRCPFDVPVRKKMQQAVKTFGK